MTERRGDEPRVRAALNELEAPDEQLAEERAHQVVDAAFAERDPAMPRPRYAARTRAALLAAIAIAGLALTPAGAEVRAWIADRFEAGEEGAEPKLTSLPAPGDILVEASSGAWIARDDGARRRLGEFEHATWSPNGQFVAVSDGAELRALDPLGEFRWSITAPAEVEAFDWSTDEGFRLAYLSGGAVRVVAGDGTGDAPVANARGVRPVWRPESEDDQAIHELTYVDQENRIVLRDTDEDRVRWRTAEFGAPVSELEWSANGEVLLVEAGDFKDIYGPRGEPIIKGPVAKPFGLGDAAISPSGDQVAFVRRAKQTSELVLLTLHDRQERILYRAQSNAKGFDTPVFSPDGDWILLPWLVADQWLFIPLEKGRVSAVADITHQFSSGRSTEQFPRVAGWCCTP